MELEPGQIIDRYRVRAHLGSGGMAKVYLATHTVLGSEHAIKVHTSTKRSIKIRFAREGRLQARLRHPNVVAVTDVIDLGEHAGLVMEFVDGPSLSGLLRRTRLPVGDALSLFRGLAAGLGHAHARGLIHRDLKPSNILIDVSEHDVLAKITDFGLAKSLVDEADVRTRTGATLGTPAYMPPEQIRDASKVDHRADLYGLGCLLYTVVCGRPPYRGTDVIELLDRIEARDYPDPRRAANGVPEEIARLIDDLLQPEPADRPPDVAAVLQRMDEVVVPRVGSRTLDTARTLQKEGRDRLASLERGVQTQETRGPKGPPARAATRVLAVAPPGPAQERLGAALRAYGYSRIDNVPDATQALARVLTSARQGQAYRLVVVDDGPRGGLLAGRIQRDSRLSGLVVVRADEVAGDELTLAGVIAASMRGGRTRRERSPGLPRSSRGRVLIVEDNLVQRTLVGHLVRRLGYTPIEASNGQEARRLAARSIDAMLVDVHLPDADGVQLLADIRKAGVEAPAMMLTADTEVETRVRAAEVGAAGYLEKPVRGEELERALGQLIPETAAGSTPLIDHQALEKLQLLLGDAVQEIIGLFLADLDAELAAWSACRRAGDPAQAAALARRLQPAAAHLGAAALVAACDAVLAGDSKASLTARIDAVLDTLRRTGAVLGEYGKGARRAS